MSLVSKTIHDGVAVVVIDNPPANVGTAGVRASLLDQLDGIRRDPDLRAVVITGRGNFLAGADITEFDGPLVKPQLPDVIDAIESLPLPVVAAVSGLALGGGFELALGCDARVCDTTALLGFPEVGLGILPGAGGTVRATRLAGVPVAIDLVASARRIDADEAFRAGLVDLVVDSDVVAEASRYALELGGKRLVRDRAAPASDPADIAATVERFTARARPNIAAAVDMVVRSADLDAEKALEQERALFTELRGGIEAQNLRYLFFAKRTAAKALRAAVPPAKIGRVGVAGAGTMGASLARLCAAAGLEVAVYDLNGDALDLLAAAVPGVQVGSSLDVLADTDLVIDAVFEEMSVKKQLLADLQPVVSADAIIASNTSYLDLDDMASELRTPERFAGLHFFNPADRNPLVEIIRARTTDDATIATLGSFVARLGKVPIPAGVGDGFVANHIYADYRLQAEFLVEDGASPQEVDAALVALGYPIGPFAVSDMSGLDIAWAMRKRRAATRGADERYVTIADTLCEVGRLGKKVGKGWYRYGEDARRGAPDPEVDRFIAAARDAKGIRPRTIGSAEIQDRIIGAIVCSAAGLVERGTAQRASDIDVAMTEGFAFPRWLGGPLRYASRLTDDAIVRMLASVYASSPTAYALAAPAVSGRVPDAVRELIGSVRPR